MPPLILLVVAAYLWAPDWLWAATVILTVFCSAIAFVIIAGFATGEIGPARTDD
jgi:hypothetical protein